MDKKKFVTLEMFEKYHECLIEYIGIHDGLITNEKTICPKCGTTITGDKCEKCAKAQYKE